MPIDYYTPSKKYSSPDTIPLMEQGQGRRGSSTMKFLPWMEVVVIPGIEAVGWTNRLRGRKMDLDKIR